MSKPSNTVLAQMNGDQLILDFQGIKPGIQERVADLLRTLSEMFSGVKSKNRNVSATVLGTPEGALAELYDALVRSNVRLTIRPA